MHQALLNKARRGDLCMLPPVGYIKRLTGEFALDSDEQAQGVIRLIFDEFDRLGTMRRVLRHLHEQDIRVPIRPHAGPNKGDLEWRRATREIVRTVLMHPLYSGTYRYGHRQTDARRMLMDSLIKLLAKKEFESISVQDIVDEAALNRATFYLHYPDKIALLHALSDFRFRQLIHQRGISFTDCDESLRAVARVVCDYFREITNCPVKGPQIPLERSIVPVVECLFKNGLAHLAIAPGVDTELHATTAAWAIFGAAHRWFQTPGRIPAEEMAAKIETMVKPIFLSSFGKLG